MGAAIDIEDMAGDGLGGCQVEDRVGDLADGRRPAHRRSGGQ